MKHFAVPRERIDALKWAYLRRNEQAIPPKENRDNHMAQRRLERGANRRPWKRGNADSLEGDTWVENARILGFMNVE